VLAYTKDDKSFEQGGEKFTFGLVLDKIRVNDPSAGSPTETLLRLLLPLNEQV
jgi:hypothetical protein